jgi:hypothetical protein
MSRCFSFFFARRHPYEDKGFSWPVDANLISLEREVGPVPAKRTGQIWFVANPEVIQSRHNEISTHKSACGEDLLDGRIQTIDYAIPVVRSRQELLDATPSV